MKATGNKTETELIVKIVNAANFDSLESIDAWRQDSGHIAAKNKARSTWLEDWQLRICRIEDVYGKS